MSIISQQPRPPPPPQINIAPQSLHSSFSSLTNPPLPPTPPNSLPVDAISEPDYPDFTPQQARHNPRKYTGYRVFSRYVASDQAFFIVRRFGTLNARVLLAMQDEIAALEDK
jgi:hypothetical protein